MHSNIECPICSVIHKSSVISEDQDERQFTPRKRTKGIIYYGDRVEELLSSPEQLIMKAMEGLDGSPIVTLNQTSIVEAKEEEVSKESVTKRKRGRPRRK